MEYASTGVHKKLRISFEKITFKTYEIMSAAVWISSKVMERVRSKGKVSRRVTSPFNMHCTCARLNV